MCTMKWCYTPANHLIFLFHNLCSHFLKGVNVKINRTLSMNQLPIKKLSPHQILQDMPPLTRQNVAVLLRHPDKSPSCSKRMRINSSPGVLSTKTPPPNSSIETASLLHHLNFGGQFVSIVCSPPHKNAQPQSACNGACHFLLP